MVGGCDWLLMRCFRHAAIAVDELLNDTRRRLVQLRAMPEKLKAGSELTVKTGRSIPNNVEPASFDWALRTKSGNDDMPTGFYCLRHLLHVCQPVFWVSQEMKD